MMRSGVSLVLLVAVLACTKPAAPGDEQPTIEQPTIEQPTVEASVVEPTPSVGDSQASPPGPVPTKEPSPTPEPTPLADISEDLAVAWYDADRPERGLHLSCDSHARWIGDPLGPDPCVPPGTPLRVLDRYGAATWTTGERSKLEREGARMPDESMMLLVAKDHVFPPDAKLEHRDLHPPSKSTRKAAKEVQRRLREIVEEGIITEESVLVAVAELPGRFGDADKIAVFEVEWNEDLDLPGWQVLAALDGSGELVAVLESELSVGGGGYDVAGVSDIDGDGFEEVLWWSFAEGMGVMLQLSHVVEGRHRSDILMNCECGGAFLSVYGRGPSVKTSKRRPR